MYPPVQVSQCLCSVQNFLNSNLVIGADIITKFEEFDGIGTFKKEASAVPGRS